MALIMLATTAVQAQKAKQRLAERHAAVFDFERAARVYEDITNSKHATTEDRRRLADIYLKLGQQAKALAIYKELAEANDPPTGDLLAYAQALRNAGKYEEAIPWYRAYAKERPNDEWVQQYLRGEHTYMRLLQDTTRDRVRSLDINSPQADLAPAVMQDLLIFSSARGEGVGGRSKYNWDQEPYLDLYSALLKGENATDPMVMRRDLNSRYHDGAAAYDAKRKRLYFTRDNFFYGKLDKASDGEIKLGIYFSDITEGALGQPEWGGLIPFEHNNPEYNVGHPAVSPNGDRLYFVSDMPGGIGGTDIWYCERKGSEWGTPKNLGSKVNTPGNEMHPFISVTNRLYFSSTGHPGLGGYDIFSAQITAAGIGRVFNLGIPINSAYDDLSLILLDDDTTGFFASDRPGGVGGLDIYGCTVHPPLMRIEGVIVDKLTRAPLDGALLDLRDAEGNFIEAAQVEMLEGGRFTIELPFSDRYDLSATRSGYRQASTQLDSNTDDLYNVVLEMDKYDYGAEGIAKHGETQGPMDSVKVSLLDNDGNVIEEVLTGPDGKYQFALREESDYRITAEKDGFFKQSTRLTTKGKTNTVINTDFNLFPLQVDQVVRLDNIYYDLAKWNIRPDAAAELDKLVQTLEDNPTVKIELSAHTDCRGSAAYNLELSRKRAKSAVDYLIKQGIAKDRLTSKGYGMTRPVEDCACGDCTEEQHQANRRTEFKVLEK